MSTQHAWEVLEVELAGPVPETQEQAAPRAAAAALALAEPPARAAAAPVGRYTALGERVKDVTDRVLATAALLLLLPLLVGIALAIRLETPGPTLFRQPRVGRHGRRFLFYKFRGMFVDARERFPELYAYRYTPAEFQALHFHSEEDPRVTRVGRFIRRTSLDELPNLINVVLGDMSLVGPRPEIPELIPYYGATAERILGVKPGITSLAKLVGRDHLSYAETLELDLEYLRTRSLAKDFRILFATAVLVLTGRNVGW